MNLPVCMWSVFRMQVVLEFLPAWNLSCLCLLDSGSVGLRTPPALRLAGLMHFAGLAARLASLMCLCGTWGRWVCGLGLQTPPGLDCLVQGLPGTRLAWYQPCLVVRESATCQAENTSPKGSQVFTYTRGLKTQNQASGALMHFQALAERSWRPHDGL